jgi:hypothetical protein
MQEGVTGSIFSKSIDAVDFSWAVLSLHRSLRDRPPTFRALILKHQKNYRYTGYKEETSWTHENKKTSFQSWQWHEQNTKPSNIFREFT